MVVSVFLVGFAKGLGVGIDELAVIGGLVDLRHCIEVFVSFVVYLSVFGSPFEGIGLGLLLFLAVCCGSIYFLAGVMLVRILCEVSLAISFGLKKWMV